MEDQELLKQIPPLLLQWYDGSARVPALAGRSHPVSGVGVGDHAAADPGGSGQTLLPAVFRGLPHGGGFGGSPWRKSC